MVSIIVPVYNGEQYLIGCLDSLIEQTLGDFEVLVVDNNSTDSSAEIARGYSGRDPRFKTLSCITPGVSSARNYGLNRACGKYVFFLDCDDTLEPDALSVVISSAEQFNCDIVMCNISRIEQRKPRQNQPFDSSRDGGRLYTDDEVPLLFASKLTTYVPFFVFKLYRTDFLKQNQIEFDSTLSLGEDLLFNIDAFSHASRAYYICQPLYRYNVAPGSLNFKYRNDLIELKTMLFDRIKQFLNAYGQFNDSYYTILMNDVYAMITNQPNRLGVERVISSQAVSELLHSRVWKYLSLKKKMVYFCLKFRLSILLCIAARL